jgi:hypothetical protein
MLAVAVPAVRLPPAEVTVIVSVWFVFTALLAVAGVMAIFASTHVLFAALLLPATPLVVRDTEPSPAIGMLEVADITVVPVAAAVITTVQLAVVLPPVYEQLGDPTKLPGPLVMLAVAVPPAAPMFALMDVTVIVRVWFVPTALKAVEGVIAIVASAHVLLAGPLLPAKPLVVRVTEPSP